MNITPRVRRIGAAVATVAAIAAIGSATSSTAGAIPVLCPVIIGQVPANDPVRITAVSFDLGGGTLDNNEPSGCGTLSWNAAGNTIEPHLDATLFAKNTIGAETRVRLRYYDVHDALLRSLPGASHLVGSNSVEEFTISLGNYANPLIYRVDVELQVLSQGNWTTVGSESEFISSSTKSPDAVTIDTAGLDFGAGVLVGGTPDAAGTVTWDLTNNTITPHTDGVLFMRNALGTTARMQMRLFDVFGNLLAAPPGAEHEPASNALETFTIDFGAVSSPLVYRVEVSLNVLVGGVWTPVGTPVDVFI